MFEEAESGVRRSLATRPVAAPRTARTRAVAVGEGTSWMPRWRQRRRSCGWRHAKASSTTPSASIYQRMHRFEEAAAAFGNYVNSAAGPRSRRSRRVGARDDPVSRIVQQSSRRSILGARRSRRAGRSLDACRSACSATRSWCAPRSTAQGRSSCSTPAPSRPSSHASSRGGAASRRSPTTESAGVGDVGTRGLQIGRIDTLEIGSLKIKNVPCLIRNPRFGGFPSASRSAVATRARPVDAARLRDSAS